MKFDLDNIKGYLPQYVESITQHSKGGMYVCPICGSGTGPNKSGAFSIKDGRKWHCFACGEGGDLFDLIAIMDGCSNSEATSKAVSLYGNGQPLADLPKAQPKEKPAQLQPRHDYTDYVTACAEALLTPTGAAALSYLQGRGLTMETIDRFALGYDAHFNAVVFPYPPAEAGKYEYYATRTIDKKGYYKPETAEAGAEPLFNADALYRGAEVVFVVESQICAISIEQAGGAAVAIGGKGHNKLLEQLNRNPTKAALALCLDNDEAGHNSSLEIAKQLNSMGYMFAETITELMGEEKDPNDVLQHAGGAVLAERIKAIVDSTKQAKQEKVEETAQEHATRSGADMVDTFLQDVQSRKYEPLPTGIADIDKALHGGLMRQQLVILGAAPGVGKTALAQWIFESMAAQDAASCIFLNLEMSREQILARSLSRMAARQGAKVNALEILQGYSWTDAQRGAIMAAAEEYKATIAPNMIYNPDGMTADLDGIITYLDKEIAAAHTLGQKTPCIVIDYLQLISGRKGEDSTQAIKRAVAELKALAIRHNTVVLLISANNRESNKTGSATMESSRDTSAIEYTADIQLALTFTDCIGGKVTSDEIIKDTTTDRRQKITLFVTKSRFGGAGTRVDLRFNGESMTYTQTSRRSM